ncbi:hypothetical protein CQW23_26818 [Capsicum baccatum]|uniref:Uncharacterized protein n=1 Tax=Capsicum baccatum TaxID=33114 RepID=A0A2G2VPW3_CAPBA|nr:hypothetical protein CQW23_26818 [Capsicum baccatum]
MERDLILLPEIKDDERSEEVSGGLKARAYCDFPAKFYLSRKREELIRLYNHPDNIVSLSEKISPSSSVITQNISNEDTMQEYANLKLSLLFYDAILTIVGSFIVFFAGEKSAIAFLTGGIRGLLYLLLVQRFVDVTSIASKYALIDVAQVCIVGIRSVNMSVIR